MNAFTNDPTPRVAPLGARTAALAYVRRCASRRRARNRRRLFYGVWAALLALGWALT